MPKKLKIDPPSKGAVMRRLHKGVDEGSSMTKKSKKPYKGLQQGSNRY